MNTKNNSTPRRSARLSNPSVIPDAPISAPPVNLATNHEPRGMDVNADAPISAPRAAAFPSMDSIMESLPARASVDSSVAQNLASNHEPRGMDINPDAPSSKKRWAAVSLTNHKPREMKVNKQIRDALLTGKPQIWMRATNEAGKKIKVDLRKYKPSKEPFLGMSIEYCVNYDGRHSVPPDLPNSSVLLKQLCLGRVPANYLENKHVVPMSMMLDVLFEYLKETFDMPLKELSAIIESISEAELVAAARAHAPTVVNADAPIPAPHAAASPSMDSKIDSIMDALGASISLISSHAQNQAKSQERHEAEISSNRSAIAGLTESQARFQAAFRESHEANASVIAGLAESQARFQTTFRELQADLDQSLARFQASFAQSQAASRELQADPAQNQANQAAYRELQADLAGLDSGHKASEAEN